MSRAHADEQARLAAATRAARRRLHDLLNRPTRPVYRETLARAYRQLAEAREAERQHWRESGGVPA